MRDQNSSGQAFLELVISLTLLTIIVLAITLATANGLKSSQFAKNQVQATKLAQEGIEKVRAIRDRNYTVCGDSANPTSLNKFNSLWTTPCAGSSCKYVLRPPVNGSSQTCGGTVVVDPYWIQYTPTPEAFVVNNYTFQRSVEITDSGSPSSMSVKEVRVKVSWRDSSGDHSSDLVTILTNY